MIDAEKAMHEAVETAIAVLLDAAPDGDAEDARELLEAVFALVALAYHAVPRWTLQHLAGEWGCVFGLLRDGVLIAQDTVVDTTAMECARKTARMLTAPRDG